MQRAIPLRLVLAHPRWAQGQNHVPVHFSEHLSVVKQHTIVIYPREEMKTFLPTKTCPQMFITALLLTAHSHKQPKQLSTDERFAERGTSFNNRLLCHSKKDAIDTCNGLDGAQRHFYEMREGSREVTHWIISFI